MIELGETRPRHRHDLLPRPVLPHRHQPGRGDDQRRDRDRVHGDLPRDPEAALQGQALLRDRVFSRPARPADPQAPHPAPGGECDLPRHQEHRRARAHPHGRASGGADHGDPRPRQRRGHGGGPARRPPRRADRAAAVQRRRGAQRPGADPRVLRASSTV